MAKVPEIHSIFKGVFSSSLKDEPNLTMPPPDNPMSSLERQGFAKEVTANTWNYKL